MSGEHSGENSSEERRYNRVLGWVRNFLVYLLIGFLMWKAQPSRLSVAVGFVFVALGESVRFWAAGHLFKTQKLITSGPYRYTRNPLYLGRLLIFSGATIMANLPLGPMPHLGSVLLLVGGWGLFFGYYLRRKERVEPARLAELHGEAFNRYFAAVPALFPRLTPWDGASKDGWKMERMLRNREQFMVIGLLLLSAYFLWRAVS